MKGRGRAECAGLVKVIDMASIKGFRKYLAVAALSLAPIASHAGVFISVGFAPPALPVYTQPLCPGDGFLWTPGYWSYGPDGYYWVPGVWVRPPQTGFLWTPGYWGWGGSAFIFHTGYWGTHVGFYGGVPYGFGYGGIGYAGGYWNHGAFAYNRSVNNINVTNIHNTYVQNVTVNNVSRVSYNGGNGGLQARPTQQEQVAGQEQHVQPTANQQQHELTARADRQQYANVNHGNPQTRAMSEVGQRQQNQQQRIGNGVGSGQMTARETANTERREGNINQTVRQDRQANGGTLTPQERQNVNQRQNNVSNSIYQDKHNAATQGTATNGFGAQRQQQVQPQRQAQPQQPRPQARPQAAPKAEGHEGGGGERR